MATVSYPQEPIPVNPPNFADEKFRSKIREAVKGLSAKAVLYHLSECLMHRDGVILKVLCIYWSLWRFGLGHQRVIQVAWGQHSNGYNGERVARYNPGKYNQNEHRSLFDGYRDPGSEFTAFLRSQISKELKEASAWLPQAFDYALEEDTRLALLAATLELFYHCSVTTQHGNNTKAPGGFLGDFVKSFDDADASSHLNAADALLQRVRTPDAKRLRYYYQLSQPPQSTILEHRISMRRGY